MAADSGALWENVLVLRPRALRSLLHLAKATCCHAGRTYRLWSDLHGLVSWIARQQWLAEWTSSPSRWLCGMLPLMPPHNCRLCCSRRPLRQHSWQARCAILHAMAVLADVTITQSHSTLGHNLYRNGARVSEPTADCFWALCLYDSCSSCIDHVTNPWQLLQRRSVRSITSAVVAVIICAVTADPPGRRQGHPHFCSTSCLAALKHSAHGKVFDIQQQADCMSTTYSKQRSGTLGPCDTHSAVHGPKTHSQGFCSS